MTTFSEIYKTLKAVDLRGMIDEKNGFNYLSWSVAFDLAQVHYNVNYEILKNEKGGVIHFLHDGCMFVQTSISIESFVKTMWLPLLDYRNKPMDKPNANDINKAIMRCLVKNLAMFGLGISVYKGEDLPETDKGETKEDPAEKYKHPEPTDYVEAKLNLKNMMQSDFIDYDIAKQIAETLKKHNHKYTPEETAFLKKCYNSKEPQKPVERKAPTPPTPKDDFGL